MTEPLSFADAVRRALELQGMDLLSNPLLARAVLADLVDPESGYRAMVRAMLDERLLSPFYRAGSAGDGDALLDAVSSGEEYLVAAVGASPGAAQAVALGLGQGVWTYLHPDAAWPPKSSWRKRWWRGLVRWLRVHGRVLAVGVSVAAALACCGLVGWHLWQRHLADVAVYQQLLDGLFISSENESTDDDGKSVVGLTIRNDTGQTLDYIVSFDDSDGTTFYETAMGPGEERFVWGDSPTYEVRDVAVSSGEPLASRVSWSEVSYEDGALMIEVTNTSGSQVTLNATYVVPWSVRDLFGNRASFTVINDQTVTVDAGSTQSVTFEDASPDKLPYHVYLWTDQFVNTALS